jgi:GNAT superfamily N-acetyltransferase
MDLTFPLLVDRPSEIPRIAKWWSGEWGLPVRNASFDDYVRELATLTADALPLHVLAESEGSPVGVATLRFKESHAAVAGRSYWLSGVYVEPALRGMGIASALCGQIETVARTRAIVDLYLETERLDGGLYRRLGWRPLRQMCQDDVAFLVMLKRLVNGSTDGDSSVAAR